MAALPLRHPHDRAILGLALPALGSLAIDPLISLVDTIFVGRLGPAPLGALAINSALFSLSFLVFNFLAYGTTPKVGRALGRGDRGEAGRVVVQALGLASILGVLAMVALEASAGMLLSLMGADGELRAPALTYLRIRALAGPAVLLTTASHGAFRGYQDTKTPLYVALVVNLTNLVLDPLLIFWLGWGIAGAAWGTVVAQWLGALIFLVLLLRTRREAMGIRLLLPRIAEMLPLIRVGGHMLLRTGALLGTMALSTAVAARLGVISVAAHQVGIQLWGFLALVVDTFAVAGQALIAHHLGRGDGLEARSVGNRLLQWGLGVGLLLACLFWAMRPWLPAVFTDDPETAKAVLEIFSFVAILQPINGLVFVWDGLYMGAEAFRYIAWAMVASAAGAVGLLLLVLPLDLGLVGVWWGIVALMAIRTLTLAIPWWRGRVLPKTAQESRPLSERSNLLPEGPR